MKGEVMKKYFYAFIASLVVFTVSSLCLAAVVIAFAIDSEQTYNNDLISTFMVCTEILSVVGLAGIIVLTVLLETGNRKKDQRETGESEKKE